MWHQSYRHPEEPRSGVSKDERPGWWPCILRGSLRSHLRMTEEEIVRHVGDILSLIAARFTPHTSASATEFKRSFAAA
ncbi:hypothetical protein ACVIYL_002301 [Bradyrhizobium sp. USDA 3315]